MLKSGIEDRIKKRIAKLKSGRARKYFLSDISYPKRRQDQNRYDINKSIKVVEGLLPELLSLLKLIRPYFDKIWDQNNIVAAYLLLGKTHKMLHSVVDEAKKGNPTSIVELARSGQEAVDLAFLFLDEKGSKYLRKWYRGEIISNSEARKALDKAVNDMFTTFATQPILVKKMKDDVYWGYSLYTHSGYGAMLDMVDVYHEDFDFEGYAGFHYTDRYLHLIQNLVVNLLLGMKNVFVYCKDLDGISKVDTQLSKFQSSFATPEEITVAQDKYR